MSEDCGQSHDCVSCQFGEEEFNRRLQEGIEKRGWIAIPVSAEIPFCYTVGLTETYDHPEFIMKGRFDPHQMISIIGEAVTKLEEDRDAFDHIEVGGVIKVMIDGELRDGSIGCMPVKEEEKIDHLYRASTRYGDDSFDALQLIFPDPAGLLPWNHGFNAEWGENQPALWTN